MPAFETMDRNQKALLWEATGNVSRDGRYKVSAEALEINVRWNHQQSEALDPQGNTISLDATLIVNREIVIGSILWEGSLEALWALLPGTGTGTDATYVPTSGLMEVVTASRVKDIKGRNIRRTLGLKRYGDNMPVQE